MHNKGMRHDILYRTESLHWHFKNWNSKKYSTWAIRTPRLTTSDPSALHFQPYKVDMLSHARHSLVSSTCTCLHSLISYACIWFAIYQEEVETTIYTINWHLFMSWRADGVNPISVDIFSLFKMATTFSPLSLLHLLLSSKDEMNKNRTKTNN